MKLSHLITDDAGKPTFRIEPPPEFVPMPRLTPPQKGVEAFRQMVNADDENRANACAWLHLFEQRSAEHEHNARVCREIADRLRDALSEVAL